MKIGITGAEGTIGSVLRKGLSKKYKIISFTLQTQDFESVQVDLSNNNEIKGKFEGLDALIHLAADPTHPLAYQLPILTTVCRMPGQSRSNLRGASPRLRHKVPNLSSTVANIIHITHYGVSWMTI